MNQRVLRCTIQELLQINIHHHFAPRGHIPLSRQNGVLRATSRAKAVAVFTESWIEEWLQDLQQRLLDQTVGDRRNTQLTLTAVRLGNHHTPYRTGPVDTRKKLFTNRRPLAQQMFGGLFNVQTVDARSTLVGLDPLPCPFQVFSRKGPFQQPLPCVVGFIFRAIDLVADGASHGFTVRSLHPPRVWQASDFRSFASTWPITLSLVRPFVRKKKMTTTASADFSLRLAPSPFQARGEISPGKNASFPAHTPDLRSLIFYHKSFAVYGPLALIGFALYPVLVHRLAFLIHASSPHSVTLMQLRFTSFAVVSSRRDFHPQACAHAGRTTKTRHRLSMTSFLSSILLSIFSCLIISIT
ncbi:hypothetical protein OU5_P0111 (plasmid) [Pseudomonas mandelii JR-1]|uniref:Uncharacterized protein n=1 Tax=Pseudomonas mandelii JR-1 TaxID=1147786 RepID=A0A024ELU1_9PSED|nr:hypothetical protein OU5_P0111 [Pseudomonas mandelii JR-1]